MMPDNVMMHLIIFGITFVTTMKSLFDSGECRDIACKSLQLTLQDLMICSLMSWDPIEYH